MTPRGAAHLERQARWIRGFPELPNDLRAELEFNVSGWEAGGIDDATLQKRLTGIVEHYEPRLHIIEVDWSKRPSGV
jgi:hypothetical protein